MLDVVVGFILVASKSMTLGGKTVATQDWVSGRGYLTGLPDSITASTIKATASMSIGVQKVATQYWCMTTKGFATQDWVIEQLKSYAKSDHTHSDYAKSDHSHKYKDITDKPTTFKPSKHKHKFSTSYKLSWGHMHTTAKTFEAGKNTSGVYNYADKTISISGTTDNN